MKAYYPAWVTNAMALTSDQLGVIRECAKDDDAYQKILSLIGEIDTPPGPNLLSQAGLLLNLDDSQVRSLLEVFDKIPVPIYVKDRDSRFVLANRLACKGMGVPDLESLIGKTDFDFLPEASAQRYFEAEQSLLETGQPLPNFEIFIPEERGGPTWYLVTKAPLQDHTGQITGLMGVNRDITERKLAASALSEERNLLQTIIDHIPDKIYIKDRQSHFVLANRATITAQHRSCLEDVVGTTDFDYMNPERAQEHLDGEQVLMETGEAIVNQELFVPEELAGQPMWFLVTKMPISSDDGSVTGLVGINRDITARKVAEQRALELALEQERSRILADFITDASHEFRTAVTIIQTSAYLLSKTSDYDKQQQQVAYIVSQLNSLVRLIDSLITMSRLDRTTQLEEQETRLDDLLRLVVESVDAQAEDRALEIEMRLDNAVPPVRIDREKLVNALSNILSNAIHYTPDGGKITVRTFAQDGCVAVEISDTGMGMTEDVQQHIFTRFYRADAAHTTHGFGLGLPIAQRIVELHQGRIEVESAPDSGSTFRVILPRVPVSAHA